MKVGFFFKVMVIAIFSFVLCTPSYAQLNSLVKKTIGKEVVKKQVKGNANDAVQDAIVKQALKRGIREKVAEQLKKEGFESFFDYGCKKIIPKVAKTKISLTKTKMTKSAYKVALENKTARKPLTNTKRESALLASLIPKTAIYKKLERIEAKGPIRLKKKEFDYLMQYPDKANLKSMIEVYTGDKNNFLEFFIRLADGDPAQVSKILSMPDIKRFVDSAIRSASGEKGYHEWLMTKNFESFLVDKKWGNDGHFLAIALTELTQKTRNVNFKLGGGHPSSGRQNSSSATKFHNELSKVINSCNTKEELFIKIREFAKENLVEESYAEFIEIFKNVLKPETN